MQLLENLKALFSDKPTEATQQQFELALEGDIIQRAQNVVDYARSKGYVVEITLRSEHPPRMGAYRESIGIRKVRATSTKMALVGLSNKPLN